MALLSGPNIRTLRQMVANILRYQTVSPFYIQQVLRTHNDVRENFSLASVNNTVRYLRRSNNYRNTTYRGYDSMIHMLQTSPRSGVSPIPLTANLLKKLGYAENEFYGSDLQPQSFVDSLQRANVSLKSIRSLNRSEFLLFLTLLASATRMTRSSLDGLLKFLETESARRVGIWEAETCLLVADLWIMILGHTAMNSVFFNVLLQEWIRVKHSDSNHRFVVQLLYYISLKKTVQPDLMNEIQRRIELHVSLYGIADMAIICQGFFKTSVKITSSVILNDIANKIRTMMDQVDNSKSKSLDSFYLVYFLKVLRHANYENVSLCTRLSSFTKSTRILGEADLLQIAHFSAFFANNRFYDRELFVEFDKAMSRGLDKDLSQIDYSHTNLLRIKDLARLLWSLSSVAHLPSDSGFWSRIVEYLHWRVQLRHHLMNPHHFVDCLHSLAIVGTHPVDLIDEAIKLKFDKIRSSPRMKPLQQLQVIKASADLEITGKIGNEFPGGLFEDEILKFGEMRSSHHLKMMRDIVDNICNSRVDLYKVCCTLRHIPISGIEIIVDKKGNFHLHSGFTTDGSDDKQKLSVEILDCQKCLQNCNLPVGLMNMKMRQLKILGYKVVKVLPSDIDYLVSVSAEEKRSWFLSRVLEALSEK